NKKKQNKQQTLNTQHHPRHRTSHHLPPFPHRADQPRQAGASRRLLLPSSRFAAAWSRHHRRTLQRLPLRTRQPELASSFAPVAVFVSSPCQSPLAPPRLLVVSPCRIAQVSPVSPVKKMNSPCIGCLFFVFVCMG
ncbi:hypothetical protein Tsubulata_009806, partial [Turnera subulata]